MSSKAPTYMGLRPASEASSRAMRANRSAGTKPEVLLRRLFRSFGLRYRANFAGLPGKPDLVFAEARLAVFCDGDFWHGRNWSALRKRLSRRSNARYWVAKIAYNIRRDAKQ